MKGHAPILTADLVLGFIYDEFGTITYYHVKKLFHVPSRITYRYICVFI